MILPVILAAGWAAASAQGQASEVAHASSRTKKKRLEALRAEITVEKAELSRLRGEIARARVKHAGQQRVSSQASSLTHRVVAAATKAHSIANPATPPAAGNVGDPLTTAKDAEVVGALARTAARNEEARVKDELQAKEVAALEDAKPTAARNLRAKALLSLPDTARTAQAVAMKVVRAEEALAKMEGASARAKRKLKIREAKDFLAAAQDDLKEHDQEAKQFLSAALEALKDGDADDEAQKALEVKKVRASAHLRKLKAEKAKAKARLAALKAKLRTAKDAILKVKEATSKVKEVSHKLVAGPLDPQAVGINLARMHNKARSQLSKAQKLASVVRKLEVDKAAEQRALEREKQSHKAVMTDMIELQKVEAKLVEVIHH